MPVSDAAPDDLETFISAAHECLNQDQCDQAIAEATKALDSLRKKAPGIRLEKELGRLCIQISSRLASEKRQDELLAFSEKVLSAEIMRKNDRVVAGIYHSLASCFYGVRQFDKAIHYYDLALNLKDDHFQYDNSRYLFLWKMKALRELGRIDEAIAEMKKVYGPSTSDNDHLILAEFYETAGRLPEAISEYETALHLAPDNKMAYIRLKQLGKDPAAAYRQRETVVVREIVKIPCPYCGTLVESTVSKCHSCGAPQRR